MDHATDDKVVIPTTDATGEEISIPSSPITCATEQSSNCFGAALLEALDSSVVKEELLASQIAYFTTQHAALVSELQHIGETLSPDMLDSVESMRKSAVVLEGIFARIDILDDLLVLISKVAIGPVAAAVKGVHAPRDIKGKATSVLRSLGFKSKSMEDDATGAIWSRIPPTISVSCATVPDRIFSNSSIAAEVAIPVAAASSGDSSSNQGGGILYEKPNQLSVSEYKSIIAAIFDEYHAKMEMLETRIQVEAAVSVSVVVLEEEGNVEGNITDASSTVEGVAE